MKITIIMLALLALAACGGEEQKSAEFKLSETSSPANVTYRVDDSEYRADYEKPTLDSVSRWIDENSNVHVAVYATNFPAVGDSGIDFVITIGYE